MARASFAGGFGARAGQAGGGGGERGAGGGGGSRQVRDLLGTGLDGGEAGCEAVEQRRQLAWRDGVLAGGGAEREQALLGLLQAARIGLGIGGEAGQQRLGLGQRFLGPFEGGDRGSGLAIGALRGDQAVERPPGGAKARRRGRASGDRAASVRQAPP